ncbi:MAG TPA: N-acetyltransferase [Erysipelotrichaceae bacterium]|nr:N-acetyltransferase [Erysipelotrichaceae bacterium]
MDINISVKDTQLRTERLLLRPFETSDLDDFYAYASVEGVGEMAGWPHHTDIELTKKILQEFVDKKEVFAIVHLKSLKVIGSLGIHRSWANEDPDLEELKVKEIGYVLAKPYWGQGLMVEAVNAVLRHGFEHWKLDAFTVGHFKHNAQSRRVIEKCGFTFYKEDIYQAKQMNQTFEDRKYIRFRNEER